VQAANASDRPAGAGSRPADGHPRFGAQVEAVFALWRASAIPLLGASVLYTAAGLLPLLTLGPMRAALLDFASTSALASATPFASAPDPAAVAGAARAWATSPATWAVFAACLVLGIAAVTAMLVRQAAIAGGTTGGFGAMARSALARLPAALGAWLGYFAVMALATAPIGAALAAFFLLALQAQSIDAVLAWMAAACAAALLLSVPLAWASVAFAFAPVAASVDGDGPLASLARSVRRVRGHWVRSATLLTLPWLVYLGLSGALSSLAMLVAMAVAYARGGLGAVFAAEWLGWAQLGAAFPGALLAPLPFAGMIVAWRDLQGLNGIQSRA
jgi:hypothetical protein